MPRIDYILKHKAETSAGHDSYWPYDTSQWENVPFTVQAALDEVADKIADEMDTPTFIVTGDGGSGVAFP